MEHRFEHSLLQALNPNGLPDSPLSPFSRSGLQSYTSDRLSDKLSKHEVGNVLLPPFPRKNNTLGNLGLDNLDADSGSRIKMRDERLDFAANYSKIFNQRRIITWQPAAIKMLVRALNTSPSYDKPLFLRAMNQLAFMHKQNSELLIAEPVLLLTLAQELGRCCIETAIEVLILLTNLSSASKLAAERIVLFRRLMDDMIKLCTGEIQSVSLRALGALNCVTREAKQHLISSQVKALRALQSYFAPLNKSDNQLKFMILLASCIHANIMQTIQLKQWRADVRALKTAVTLLEFSLDGQTFFGVSCDPMYVLRCVEALACNTRNRAVLLEMGMVDLVLKTMVMCSDNHEGIAVFQQLSLLELCLKLLGCFASISGGKERIVRGGVMNCLQHLAYTKPGQAVASRAKSLMHTLTCSALRLDQPEHVVEGDQAAGPRTPGAGCCRGPKPGYDVVMYSPWPTDESAVAGQDRLAPDAAIEPGEGRPATRPDPLEGWPGSFGLQPRADQADGRPGGLVPENRHYPRADRQVAKATVLDEKQHGMQSVLEKSKSVGPFATDAGMDSETRTGKDIDSNSVSEQVPTLSAPCLCSSAPSQLPQCSTPSKEELGGAELLQSTLRPGNNCALDVSGAVEVGRELLLQSGQSRLEAGASLERARTVKGRSLALFTAGAALEKVNAWRSFGSGCTSALGVGLRKIHPNDEITLSREERQGQESHSGLYQPLGGCVVKELQKEGRAQLRRRKIDHSFLHPGFSSEQLNPALGGWAYGPRVTSPVEGQWPESRVLAGSRSGAQGANQRDRLAKQHGQDGLKCVGIQICKDLDDLEIVATI